MQVDLGLWVLPAVTLLQSSSALLYQVVGIAAGLPTELWIDVSQVRSLDSNFGVAQSRETRSAS